VRDEDGSRVCRLELSVFSLSDGATRNAGSIMSSLQENGATQRTSCSTKFHVLAQCKPCQVSKCPSGTL
jgi:hypothetical protein